MRDVMWGWSRILKLFLYVSKMVGFISSKRKAVMFLNYHWSENIQSAKRKSSRYPSLVSWLELRYSDWENRIHLVPLVITHSNTQYKKSQNWNNFANREIKGITNLMSVRDFKLTLLIEQYYQTNIIMIMILLITIFFVCVNFPSLFSAFYLHLFLT